MTVTFNRGTTERGFQDIMTSNTDNNICDSLLQSLLQAIECAKNDDCKQNVDYPTFIAKHRRDGAIIALGVVVKMVEEVKRQYIESVEVAGKTINTKEL